MTIAFDEHYARMADSRQRAEDRMGHVYGGDVAITGLRAFIRYHPDARQDVPIAGRVRSLTHNQVRMLGLFSRIELTREHTTIRAMAREANVCPSTVSRFMLKVQAWGAYAIDVSRGRYGGVTIRRRQLGDQLADYATRAWERIKRAADRAAFNVASRLLRRETAPEDGTDTDNSYMDATLNEAWDAAEAAGQLLVAQIRADTSPPLARDPGAFDPGRLTAENVIHERYWLDTFDPDWDLELEKVRDSYGLSDGAV